MLWRTGPYVLGLVLLTLGVTHSVPRPLAAVAGVAGVLAIVAGAAISVRHGYREGPFVSDPSAGAANRLYGPAGSGPGDAHRHHHSAGFHGGFGGDGGGHHGGGHHSG